MNLKRIILVFLLFFPLSLAASQLFSLSLKDISERSELIFRGTCEKKLAETLRHPQTGKEIPVTVTIFSTKDVVKGEAGSKIEVKQLAVRSSREAYSLGIYGAVGGVSFEVGKDYLLFLGAPSSLGVRSVIGAGAGKYLVTKSPEGKEVVSSASDSKTISYEEFLSTIRKNIHE